MPSQISKPMLAVDVKDVANIVFPIYAQPKIDGIRCLKVNGQVVSRNFKPIPNVYIRSVLERILPEGIDGEIVGADMSNFQATVSAVMDRKGEPEFYYNAFDYVSDDINKPYAQRAQELTDWYVITAQWMHERKHFVRLVQEMLIQNVDELRAFENKCLADGYEGLILRKIDGRYKCGRSTVKEQLLLKLKRFVDSEAKIIGFECLMHNENAKEKDAFGDSKRSSKKDGLVAVETLGTIVVEDRVSKVQFKIGTGFDANLRKQIWDDRDNYMGKLVKYKYFEIGEKDKPRFPVFLGFRHENDMD